VVWKNIGRKKTVRTALGASGQLKQDDTAVFVYDSVEAVEGGDDEDKWVIGGSARGFSQPCFILSGLVEDVAIERLTQQTQLWSSRSVWTREGSRSSHGLSMVLSDLMNARAWPDSHDSTGLRARNADAILELTTLREEGVVEEKAGGCWFFTAAGHAQVTLSKRLCAPQLVFALRD
jgi:hypothetical protein